MGGGGGGLFWRLKAPSNDLDPDFDRSSLRLCRLFCPYLGDLKKKKKKKRKKIFTQIESVYFSPNLGDLRKKKRSSTRLKPSFSDLNYTSGP